LSDDPEPVIIEVSEAVGSALNEFHFSVEALGDSIVFCKPPHAGDLFLPVGECSGQRGERSKATAGQLLCKLKEPANDRSALSGSAVFDREHFPEAGHLAMQNADGWILSEEPAEALVLSGRECAWLLAQGSKEASLLFDLRSDLAEELQEVVLHDANDVEAISNDFCIGEVASDDSAVGGTQVDADQPYSLPAFQRVKEGFEGAGTLSFDHIEDFVIAEIAEGGGEAAALVEGVFVDAEFEGALQADALASFAVGMLVVDAFDGGAAQGSAGSHRRTADAFVMKLVDTATEGLGGMSAGPDAFERLHEAFRTAQAAVSAAADQEGGLLTEAFEMSDATLVSALAVEAAASTARAGAGPSHWLGRDSERRLALILDNAVSFQSY
jgi:hypothetical protein